MIDWTKPLRTCSHHWPVEFVRTVKRPASDSAHTHVIVMKGIDGNEAVLTVTPDGKYGGSNYIENIPEPSFKDKYPVLHQYLTGEIPAIQAIKKASAIEDIWILDIHCTVYRYQCTRTTALSRLGIPGSTYETLWREFNNG